MQKTSTNPIVVYHGTTSLFEEIEVSKGKPYKDFGKGFYVTRAYSHAANLATRNKRLELERFGRRCEAYVYTYEMDLEMLAGFYGDVGSDTAISTAVKMIEAEKLPPQIYFARNEATTILKQKGQVSKI